jgi:hypothetical protein
MSPQSTSREEFIQQASLSQQLSHKHPEFQDYSGSDAKVSLTIAALKSFAHFGYIDVETPGLKLIMFLLNEQRKAIFATSEKVNEITKMGLMMPKSTDAFEATENDGKDTDIR